MSASSEASRRRELSVTGGVLVVSEETASVPMRARVLGAIAWFVARLVGLTARVHYVGRDRMDAALADGGAILVTWHGRTLIAANVLRARGCWALISHSRDGEIQNQVFKRFGFQTIRGSTGRGGVRAVLQLARAIREGGVLAFTPDGPRGPTHVVQSGTIFLAQRSGRPVLPVGIAARPRKLVGSWDRYMIPGPFARAAWVVGDPIHVPADATEEEAEVWRLRLERAMNACERHAEEILGYTYPDEWRTDPPTDGPSGHAV